MAGLFYVSSMFIGTVVYRYSTGYARLVDVQRLVAAVGVFGLVGCYVNYVHYTDLNDADLFTFQGATIAWSIAYLFFFGGVRDAAASGSRARSSGSGASATRCT